MKQISLREFMQKGSQYINELPIILTQYNKPVAVVTVYEEVSTVPYPENSESINKAPTEDEMYEQMYNKHLGNKEVEVKEGVVEETETPKKIVRELVWENSATYEQVMAIVYPKEYCKYEFHKGEKRKCFLISVEDNNGNLKKDKVLTCEECLVKLREEVREYGGLIIGS